MKIMSPRTSFSLDYTPKQWVGFMNTCLLLFVTFMFALVVYNMRSVDQQLIRVLDTSVVAIDMLTTDLLHSQTNPYWRTVGQDMSVYSAFYNDRGDGKGSVLIVGSSPSIESTEDLRCLLEYEDEDDVNIAFVDYRRISNCSKTIFLFCHAKTGVVPKKVALVSNTNDVPHQWMEVRTIRTDLNRTSEDGSPKMAACVRPLQGGESVKDIAEFVAFYETVGVDHIYFYDRSARQDVVDFILELEGMGHSVNHLTWNKNDDSSTTDCPVLWLEHVQDCVHRGLDKYSDVVTVGLSDFVVPTEYFRLPTMLEQIRLSHHQNVWQLRLKSANFCEDTSPSLGINLIDLGRMTVRGEMEPSNSNYFIHLDPELVLGFRDQISEVTLPGSDVSVHRHSKRCDTLGSLDFSAFKYSHIIEQSSVLKLYKRTSKGIENQATFAPYIE